MKFLLILSCFISSIFALSLEEIPQSMQNNINTVTSILKNSTQDKSALSQEIFAIFDPVFNYELMAQLSLSKHYKNLSQKEQEVFAKAFEKQLKASFTSKLSLYKNQDIKVIKGEQTSPNRYMLTSFMPADTDNQNIVFKFHNKNNDWLIYDIDIFGISIIQSYRSQFADLLDNADFNALLQTLEKTDFSQ